MKTKRSLLMILTVSTTLLFAGTGCRMMSDLLGFDGGDQKEPDSISAPLDNPPDDAWTAPDEGVAPSSDEWTKRTDISFPSIYFSYDKCLLGTREKSILNQVADYMKKHKSLGLIVEGNCDKRGSEEYNRALGERRALSVKDYLISAGIAKERMRTLSYGDERPVAKGDTEAAFRKNRRDDLIPANMK